MLLFLESDDRRYASELHKMLQEHDWQAPLKIAVAFWGKQAGAMLEQAVPAGRLQDCRFLCNLESGATDPDVVERLWRAGAQFKTRLNLHAKVVLTRNAVLLGSANLSTNGLGADATESGDVVSPYWDEAGLVTDDAAVRAPAGSWFDRIWAASPDIDPARLAAARELRRRMRSAVPRQLVPTLENPIATLTQLLDSGQVCVTLWHMKLHKVSDSAKQHTVRKGKESGIPELSFYEDFPKLPVDTIVDLCVDERNQAVHASLWRLAGLVDKGRPELQYVLPATPESQPQLRLPAGYLDLLETALLERCELGQLSKHLAKHGVAVLRDGAALSEWLGKQPADSRDVSWLRDWLEMHRQETGLIYIKKGSRYAPAGVDIKDGVLTSGDWRHALDGRAASIRYLLVYHRCPSGDNDVWVGEFAGTDPAPGGRYRFLMRNPSEPISTALSFFQLTGKREPQGVVYAAGPQ